MSLQKLGAPDHAHVVLKLHFSLFPAGWASYASTDSALLLSAPLVHNVCPCVKTLCLKVSIPTHIPGAVLPGSSRSQPGIPPALDGLWARDAAVQTAPRELGGLPRHLCPARQAGSVLSPGREQVSHRDVTLGDHSGCHHSLPLLSSVLARSARRQSQGMPRLVGVAVVLAGALEALSNRR